jgi:hypothetical protein
MALHRAHSRPSAMTRRCFEKCFHHSFGRGTRALRQGRNRAKRPPKADASVSKLACLFVVGRKARDWAAKMASAQLIR